MTDEPLDLTASIVANLENFTGVASDEIAENGVLEEVENLDDQQPEEGVDLTEEQAEQVVDFLEELAGKYPEYFSALQQEKADPRSYLENLIRLDIEFRKNPQETLKRLAGVLQVPLEPLEPEEQEAVSQILGALREMSKSYYEALNYIHAQQKSLEDHFQRNVFASLDAFLQEQDPRGINRMELFKNDTFRNQLAVTTQALMNQNPYMDFGTATRRAFDVLISSLMPEKSPPPPPKPQVNQEPKFDKDPSMMPLEEIVASYYRMFK